MDELDLSALPGRRRGRGGRAPVDTPERILGQKVRLRMLLAMARVPVISFTDLHAIVEANVGNLSLHARRLEAWGYIAIWKGFVNRFPRTEYRLTPDGRRRLEEYLARHRNVYGVDLTLEPPGAPTSDPATRLPAPSSIASS
jgi:DNA-binding HxlR family transcriptional regulator